MGYKVVLSSAAIGLAMSNLCINFEFSNYAYFEDTKGNAKL